MILHQIVWQITVIHIFYSLNERLANFIHRDIKGPQQNSNILGLLRIMSSWVTEGRIGLRVVSLGAGVGLFATNNVSIISLFNLHFNSNSVTQQVNKIPAQTHKEVRDKHDIPTLLYIKDWTTYLKELDFSWSHTISRSELALTLSQCNGFKFGFGFSSLCSTFSLERFLNSKVSSSFSIGSEFVGNCIDDISVVFGSPKIKALMLLPMLVAHSLAW